MKIKEIKKHNGEQFLIDFKKVRAIMTSPATTDEYFYLRKNDVLKNAEKCKISYYLTDEIFLVKRTTMVIY